MDLLTDYEPRDAFMFGYGNCRLRSISILAEQSLEFYFYRTFGTPVHLVLVVKSTDVPKGSQYLIMQVKNHGDMLANGPIKVVKQNFIALKTMACYQVRSVHTSLEQLKHALDALFPNAKWAWSPTLSCMKVEPC